MATKNFTKISNEAIDNLSANALKVYAKLINLSTRKNFIIKRDYVKHLVKMGEKTFAKAWKELKDFGLLLMGRTREGKKWRYEFTLSEVENIKPLKKKTRKLVKKKDTTPVDSNGNIPLEGQVHADELLESATNELQSNELNSIDPKEIELVSTETGLENEKAEQLLKLAGIERILEVYKYSKCRAKNLFKFMFKAIKDNWDTTEIYVPASEDDNGIISFGNYTSNNSKRLKNKTFTEEEIRKAKELENDLLAWYN